MISSKEAGALHYPTINLLKVCFQRQLNLIDEGFTLKQCICYLEDHNFKSDDVVTTHRYYVFRQRILIRDATAFLYQKKYKNIIFCYQKYTYDKDCDLLDKTCLTNIN